MNPPAESTCLVCPDWPWPATHGGRLELANTIDALIGVGVSVSLVVIATERPTAETVSALAERAVPFHEVRRSGFVPATVRYPHLPYAVSSRKPSKRAASQVLLNLERPTTVISCIAHTLPWAQALSSGWDVPLIARPHNVETTYLRELYDAAHGKSKAYLGLEAARMHRWEKAVFGGLPSGTPVRWISTTDMDTFSHRAPQARHETVAPFAGSYPRRPLTTRPPHTALFFGNLYMPNNVASVVALTQAWAEVRESVPDATLLVAGRDPSKVVVDACASANGVQLLANPADNAEVYARSSFLINWVLHGSGASLKVADAISFGCPVLANEAGSRGYEHLPEPALTVERAPALTTALIGHLQRKIAEDSEREAMLTAQRILDPAHSARVLIAP